MTEPIDKRTFHFEQPDTPRPAPSGAEATQAVERCDQIVNNGMGEPTECGRTLPCEYHAASPAVGLDPERLQEAIRLTALDHYKPEAPASYAGRVAKHYAALGESDR